MTFFDFAQGGVVKKILVAEDSGFFGRMLKKKLEAETGAQVCWAQTMQEACQFIEAQPDGFAAGIVNFHLPDAPRWRDCRKTGGTECSGDRIYQRCQ